ncbi:hypothetical protein EYF80_064364 [Liparis tanakae]|uniref:Uncharacterized protein n=1 Tax=Liparis tanakae TaxID=230148 RepID=A0A4Z2E9H7_9TELE|nr:hypothetical protein EYF80_064364 [Liparis tanakae]
MRRMRKVSPEEEPRGGARHAPLHEYWRAASALIGTSGASAPSTGSPSCSKSYVFELRKGRGQRSCPVLEEVTALRWAKEHVHRDRHAVLHHILLAAEKEFNSEIPLS